MTRPMKAKLNRQRIKRRVKAWAGIIITISALVAIALILLPHVKQFIDSKPQEGKTDESIVDGVTGIDWDYWKRINPDVVAWITIPGTPIDHPIVQASKDNPTRYLDVDVYGKPNIYGCLYIDSDCSIESPNVIIYGHNMHGGNTAMFGSLTKYLDADYMRSHEQVIVQTPDTVYEVEVRAADMVSPYGYDKRIKFDSVDDLRDFYLTMWGKSRTKASGSHEQEIEKIFTLITCGDTGATRTIVYCG